MMHAFRGKRGTRQPATGADLIGPADGLRLANIADQGGRVSVAGRGVDGKIA
jgi:hypothetical protein